MDDALFIAAEPAANGPAIKSFPATLPPDNFITYLFAVSSSSSLERLI